MLGQQPLRAFNSTLTVLSRSLSNALPPQNFAYCGRKVLSTSSGSVSFMGKRGLNEIVSDNLRFFMKRSANCQNANALAVASRGRVSAGTVRNLLDKRKRTTTLEKQEGYPQLDTVAAVAEVLGREVWELLHPDIERSIKEREWFVRAERDFAGALTPERTAEELGPGQFVRRLRSGAQKGKQAKE